MRKKSVRNLVLALIPDLKICNALNLIPNAVDPKKISSSYRLTEKRNTYKATRYTLRLSWNTHISASAKEDLRGPDPEAQVRTLSAYHADRTYGVRILKLRSGPSLRIRKYMVRVPDREAQVRTLPAYHAERTHGVRILKLREDLRGPDPEAQVRTLSAYHVERTYGVRILKHRSGLSLRSMQIGPTGSGSSLGSGSVTLKKSEFFSTFAIMA
uniref:Uncharacterized protein n=1 Tax=Ananas comosus var. bracteatus TaxID=296719 RepID=A0A6V7P9D3_ANACO|nr:unnamed protein product [Ananas comosus var. bracteatus]